MVLKERDVWSNLVNFIGEMVAKYADAMELDQLPDPDNYLHAKIIIRITSRKYLSQHISNLDLKSLKNLKNIKT